MPPQRVVDLLHLPLHPAPPNSDLLLARYLNSISRNLRHAWSRPDTHYSINKDMKTDLEDVPH